MNPTNNEVEQLRAEVRSLERRLDLLGSAVEDLVTVTKANNKAIAAMQNAVDLLVTKPTLN
jgi:hypothetical protein